MMKRVMLILSCLFISIGFITAQTTRVTGIVLDDIGEPVVGASVVVKGTTIGTITDVDGAFSINVPQGRNTMVFSLVGMQSVETKISQNMRITLQSNEQALDEVVVTAFGGVVKKSSISGAQTSIGGDKIAQLPVQSFDQALSGKMAGVQISMASGLLAEGTSIRVRGTNSVSLSSQPLIVIDGVPVTETTNLNVFNSGNGTRFNPLATVNPNDIESIEVLKDAAAAALYGSRAANGVLLITTKKGKIGKPQVAYAGYVGWAKAAKTPDLLNVNDFITIQNEKSQNRFGQGVLFANKSYLNDPDDKRKYDETNWLDVIFRTAFQQNHQLSVSHATEKTNYYASADYTSQEGIVIGNKLVRGGVRVNAEAQATNWLKVGISTAYSKTANDGVLSDGYLAGVTISGYNAPPNVPERLNGNYYLASGALGAGNNLYSYNGSNTFGNRFYHPSATASLNRNKNTSERVLANAFIEITPIKELKITSKIGIDYLNNFEDQYSHPDLIGLGWKGSNNGLVQDNIVWITQWNWQTYANYNKKFGLHSLGLTAGLEYQKRAYKDVYAGAGNFVFSTYNEILDGLFTDQYTGGTKNSRGFSGYFGRTSYNYDERYYVEGSLRMDYYSGFGLNNRKGIFPGVSTAWRLSKESFMQNLESKIFDDLKLRASWGLVGNSNVGPYASRTLYAGGQYADLNGVSMSQVGNRDLKWETVKKWDFGVDALLLNQRLNVSFDYWITNISDMLLDAPVPLYTGIPNAYITTNIGEMTNKGIELQINTTNIQTTDFRWTTAFNLTTVKNNVKKLTSSGNIEELPYVVAENYPLGSYKLYKWAGVNPDNGEAGYYDKDGNIKWYNPEKKVWTNTEGETVGALTADDYYLSDKTGSPTWYGNIDNSLFYKGLDVSFGLQFAGGNYVYNATAQGLMTNNLNNNISEILDRWTTPGQKTNVPRLYHADAISMRMSDRFLEKGDFLRLRDLTLGYTLPSDVIKKLGVTSLRIYARATNLFVITDYSGSDPELSTNRNSNYKVGYDNRSVPYPRTFTLGLNLNF
ncbi:TonB-dependent receptor [Dysgonomonas sp. Marseille-Q5470]|uniref:SusC/RagA family TonB-linked outer membrane protein n=1 Tax=Dysgonomonas TaxID=156973 RepID=UPI0024BCE730|nr:TonB-dependent receptor [Dysgonomonas sp. Marseille-Q5470]